MAFSLQKLFPNRDEAEKAIREAEDIPEEIKDWALKGLAKLKQMVKVHVNIFGHETVGADGEPIHHVQVAVKSE